MKKIYKMRPELALPPEEIEEELKSNKGLRHEYQYENLLEQALARHDFTYAMSEDHRVWLAGERRMKLIQTLGAKISPTRFDEIWNTYAPDFYKRKQEGSDIYEQGLSVPSDEKKEIG